MSTTKNVIDINGNRYDAVTGAFLGATPKKPDATAVKGRPVAIDGFSRPVHAAKVPPAAASRKPAAPAHIAAHKPQKGKTLMRTAVRKPDIQAPSRLKALTRTDILAKVPATTVAPKLSHASVSPKRLKKASQMIKSPVVAKYAEPSTAAVISDMSVQKPYDLPPARHERSSASQAAVPHIAVQPVSTKKAPDIFEAAMARATSHEQPEHPVRRRSRLTSIVTFSMAFLLMAGIVAYMNAPALSMRLASSRAGFAAKMPGYSPAGFSYDNLSYGPGNVTISYESDDAGNDGRFDITQKVSGWDSQALLNNFVSSANKAYQTYERAGRTIYFYGNNTATWVDSGVWYTVNGNNALTKGQLLDMAGSL